VSTTPAELLPEQLAFLGECESSASGRPSSDGRYLVHALCWSRTSKGWAALAQSWASMKAYRDDYSPTFKHAKGHPVASSWVAAAVPSLGTIFHDTPAEESTLAAWISRAQVSIALSVINSQSPASSSAPLPYPAAILECMSGYLEFLKMPGYTPIRAVLAAAGSPDRAKALVTAFNQARDRLRPSMSLDPIKVEIGEPGEDPLPLAMTNLISAAVLRYLNEPTAGNPIFHAVRPKLIRVPAEIASPRNSRLRAVRLS
jgi:hypothetical protein